jgi:glycerol-3-phosphate dehydrogenase
VAEFIAADDDRVIQSKPTYSHREVRYLVQYEMVLHLEDLVRRRSNLMKLGELTPQMVEELARILQDELGWSTEERGDEIFILQEKMEASQ